MIRSPPISSIDGIQLDCFEAGKEYLVGNTIGALFLAERWAEPVSLDSPAPVVPFAEGDQFDSRILYFERRRSNLNREAPERRRGNLNGDHAPPPHEPVQTPASKRWRKSRRKL